MTIQHKCYIFIAAFALAAASAPAYAQSAAVPAAVDFDSRHKICLEAIADDAEIAYEDALQWVSEGGGRRANHCAAMALFALGQTEQAAYRIGILALDKDRISKDIRLGYYAESADLWLKAQRPRKAYDIAEAGLTEKSGDVALHIVRARAYAAMDRWDYAEIDLSSALAFEPENIEALRYRADTRRRLGKLSLAKADIDAATALDISDVDTLLVRGQINEAIREKTAIDAVETLPIQPRL